MKRSLLLLRRRLPSNGASWVMKKRPLTPWNHTDIIASEKHQQKLSVPDGVSIIYIYHRQPQQKACFGRRRCFHSRTNAVLAPAADGGASVVSWEEDSSDDDDDNNHDIHGDDDDDDDDDEKNDDSSEFSGTTKTSLDNQQESDSDSRTEEELSVGSHMPRQRRYNPFRDLDERRIPWEVKEQLQKGLFLKQLRRFGRMDLKGYEHYWRCLLWATEWYDAEALKRYDMKNVNLEKDVQELEYDRGNVSGSRPMWFLAVPGLAEDRPSVLPGDAVKVSWKEGGDNDDETTRTVKGTVEEVYLSHIRISGLPGFTSKSSVDVSFLPGSRLGRMLAHEGTSKARELMPLEMVAPIQRNAKKTLKRIEQQLANQEGMLMPSDIEWINMKLNPEQQQAVCQVLNRVCQPLPYLIIGPPGTGKSATVAELVLQSLRHYRQRNNSSTSNNISDNKNAENRILVLAPSNDAADNILRKISAHLTPGELVRVLSFRREPPQDLKDYVLKDSDDERTLRAIERSAVTVSTVNMAARFAYYGVEPGYFSTIVIDEAGHATEPDTIATVSKLLDFPSNEANGRGGQLVLAGDPKQLGPVVLDPESRRLGMDRSYMERMSEYHLYKRCKTKGTFNQGLVTMLTKNYRSHEDIIRLPNQMFYNGDLTCHADNATTHNMCEWEELPNKGFPVFFHSVAGENQRDESSPSWFNPQEVDQCVAYAKSLLMNLGITGEEVGIITPYTAQCVKIRRALRKFRLDGIKVGSVETFQGQERRVIIISTVRTSKGNLKEDERFAIGFVKSAKRFNVALTRAQALVVVVGCPNALATDKDNWLPFLRYCYNNAAWKGEAPPVKITMREDEICEVMRTPSSC